MIGAPLSVGLFTEVLPIAPRPHVAAPLLMERVIPEHRGARATEVFEALRDFAAARTAPWQRLVDSESSAFDQHVVFERFVGVTVRDLSHALRTHQRVLPLDVLRACVEAVLGALETLPAAGLHVMLSDASFGLGVDGRWRLAQRSLNHWFHEAIPPEWDHDPERMPTPDSSLDFHSPERISAQPETAASAASRGALFAWQLAAGGFHPYRRPSFAGQGRAERESLMERLSRFHRSEPAAPLELHPLLPRPLREVLLRGVHFSGGRFASVGALRAALDATWPLAAASPERTQAVLFGLAWPSLLKQLEALKQAPLLPIRWEGVWAAARTPEEGVAVLEDQLLERVASVDELPRAAPLPSTAPAETTRPPVAPPVSVTRPSEDEARRAPAQGPGERSPPVGLLRRLLGRIRR